MLDKFRVLFFGDVVAKAGRKAIAAVLPELKKQYTQNLTIANAENIAHGIGATEKTIAELRAAGVDFFTSGNHIWSKKEIVDIMNVPEPILIRPANYPPKSPGVGWRTLIVNGVPVLIVNLQGRVFMAQDLDCPFRMLDAILEKEKDAKIILVDFHAEASSEKVALGYYADGRVSAFVGTHTHIPTADARVLLQGTAYVTDLGMTGLRDSAIGANLAAVTEMFLTQRSHPDMHETPEKGIMVVNAVLVDIDPATGKAHSIERIQREITV